MVSAIRTKRKVGVAVIAQMKPRKMREIREGAGMNKAELARRTKMQASIIGWIEEGRYYPYSSQLEKIAEVLNVKNPDDLLEEV